MVKGWNVVAYVRAANESVRIVLKHHETYQDAVEHLRWQQARQRIIGYRYTIEEDTSALARLRYGK